jgi:hypothetical protein
MEKALEYCQSKYERLKAWSNESTGDLTIPSPLDNEVAEIVRLFIDADREKRMEIAAVFDDEHSFTFIGFSENSAALAVRSHSEKFLREGLAALILDGGKFDIRENILVLAPLYNAALKIHADAQSLFSWAAGLLTNKLSSVIRTFPSRPEESKNLASMNYIEFGDGNEFYYQKL